VNIENLRVWLKESEACLNGVYGWFWEIFAIAGILILFNFVFKKLLLFLQKRFHAKGEALKESFVSSLFIPLTCFIWFLVTVEVIDFISLQVNGKMIISFKSLMLEIAIILSITWFLLKWKNDVVRYMLTNNPSFKHHVEPITVDIVDKLVTMGILFVTVFMLLEMTGSNINTLIAFGGISGLAIAFASQEVIASFFGGLMTYITQPFLIGDWVKLPEKNIEGHVEEIGWYMTKIRTFDKTPIYIPNSNFSKIVVINPSRMSHRRIRETFGLRYSDFPRVKAVIAEIKNMLRNNRDLVPEMTQGVYLTTFGSYSLDIEITAYTYETSSESFNRIREELFFAIGDIFAKQGVDFAFPTTSIDMLNPVRMDLPKNIMDELN
jgi:MscS family membrane protein